jgi:hypothetical protein
MIGALLPDELPFYHLGEIRRADDAAAGEGVAGAAEADFAQLRGVGFRLAGELNGVFIIAFDRDLDASTYTEMGNVLASRLATEMSRRAGRPVRLSPPHALEGAPLRELLTGPAGESFRFIHHWRGTAIPVRARFAPVEESGNA